MGAVRGRRADRERGGAYSNGVGGARDRWIEIGDELADQLDFPKMATISPDPGRFPCRGCPLALPWLRALPSEVVGQVQPDKAVTARCNCAASLHLRVRPDRVTRLECGRDEGTEPAILKTRPLVSASTLRACPAILVVWVAGACSLLPPFFPGPPFVRAPTAVRTGRSPR